MTKKENLLLGLENYKKLFKELSKINKARLFDLYANVSILEFRGQDLNMSFEIVYPCQSLKKLIQEKILM